jgi:hypothetical protein
LTGEAFVVAGDSIYLFIEAVETEKNGCVRHGLYPSNHVAQFKESFNIK